MTGRRSRLPLVWPWLLGSLAVSTALGGPLPRDLVLAMNDRVVEVVGGGAAAPSAGVVAGVVAFVAVDVAIVAVVARGIVRDRRRRALRAEARRSTTPVMRYPAVTEVADRLGVTIVGDLSDDFVYDPETRRYLHVEGLRFRPTGLDDAVNAARREAGLFARKAPNERSEPVAGKRPPNAPPPPKSQATPPPRPRRCVEIDHAAVAASIRAVPEDQADEIAPTIGGRVVDCDSPVDDLSDAPMLALVARLVANGKADVLYDAQIAEALDALGRRGAFRPSASAADLVHALRVEQDRRAARSAPQAAPAGRPEPVDGEPVDALDARRRAWLVRTLTRGERRQLDRNVAARVTSGDDEDVAVDCELDRIEFERTNPGVDSRTLRPVAHRRRRPASHAARARYLTPR